MEERVTEYLRLFRKARADLPRFACGAPEARLDPDEEPKWRLRGFQFTVEGRAKWAPEADTDALLRIGRWIAGYEKLAFRGSYVTSRREGFAIHFTREEDATCFETQCLQRDSVFTSSDDLFLLNSRPTLGRTPTTQLPSGADRGLSEPFSDLLLKKLCFRGRSDSGKIEVRTLSDILIYNDSGWPEVAD